MDTDSDSDDNRDRGYFYWVQKEATRVSWEAPYIGDYDKKLASAILSMKKEANGTPYKNILPIIQSSGTGKSRLAHEVSKFFMTIPMNIRPAGDFTAYPYPDREARRVMHAAKRKNTNALLLAFWIESAFHVVDTLDSELESLRPTRTIWDQHRRAEQIHERLKANASEDGPRHLAAAIRSRLAHDFKNPDVVILIYIDEVSDVSTMELGDHLKTTVYDALLDSFTDLGPSEPIFLLTMSTDPFVVRRTGSPIRHQKPYTQLPFDVPLSGPLFTPGTVKVADVAEPTFMAKFGRPLFATRLLAAQTHDLQSVILETVSFALVKLLCYIFPYRFIHEDGASEAMIWAILSTRLHLEFDLSRSASRSLTESLVCSHMRLVYDMPTHNEFIESGTSSEPLLVEAAAWAMNKKRIEWLVDLAQFVKDGLLHTGPRGELAARTLLTFAYDRAGALQRGPEERTSYSRAVPVVVFLRALFADRWHDTVLQSAPPGAPPLQDAFADAFVRFTHFFPHDGDGTLDVNDALAAMVRGCALLINPRRDFADIAVPIVMHDAPLDVDVMSYIFVQLKTGYEPSCAPDADDMDEIFNGLTRKHPTIHLVMQLEADHGGASMAKTSDSSDGDRADEGKPAHACYKLAAYGCSPAVYKAIDEENKEHYASLLSSDPIISQHARQGAVGIAYVQRMKAAWDRIPACYDWAADSVLQGAESVQHPVEGVFVV
ncbi:hypothetical protein ONZ51_g11151 [Trametes cubensis]|uniref:Uncharacterized protein n=1 Tax=Trametes cubensis TaxID=1111947 RepID=A0AAD7TI63_9APHY|nr:hypothetical protein ONZ51_g11151 [Trametes cubensis]